MPVDPIARYAEALRMRGDGATLQAIGNAIGVSRERVRQILRDEPKPPRQPRGTPARLPQRSAIDRILARVDATSEHWVWPGYADNGHHPSVKTTEGGKNRVSRVLYEHFVGSLPRQLVKTCGVALCVRPWCYAPSRDHDAARRQMLEMIRDDVPAQEIVAATGYALKTVYAERWRLKGEEPAVAEVRDAPGLVAMTREEVARLTRIEVAAMALLAADSGSDGVERAALRAAMEA